MESSEANINPPKTSVDESVKFEEEASKNRFHNEPEKSNENHLHQHSLEVPIGEFIYLFIFHAL